MKAQKLVIIFSFFFVSSSLAQLDPIKIACVGNSITFGSNNSSAYPQQLGSRLGSNYEVRNFGVGGATMLRNGDKPYWEQEAFVDAKEFEPDIVIILLGTNDTKPQNQPFLGEYYNDYVDMINEFRSLLSEPEIFVGYPPPVFKVEWGINNPVLYDQIIPMIDSVRATMNTFWVNYYDNMLGKSSLFPDGIHPNAEGYAEMARIAEEALLNRPSGYIHYFYVNPGTVEEGENAMLKWETSDSSLVTLNGNSVNPYDSIQISPTKTEIYTLIANGDIKDTSSIEVKFLPSGNIKLFKANLRIIEYGGDERSVIIWETSNNSTVFLNGNQVISDDSLIVQPDTTTPYQLIASGAESDTSTIVVQVMEGAQINRTILADTIYSSSTEYHFSPYWIGDEDTTSYWQSDRISTEWIVVDIGREININRVKILWGDNYALTFHIQIMNEAGSIYPFFSTTSGDGSEFDLQTEYVNGRFIRLLCMQSLSDTTGYQVRELEIYGTSKNVTGIIKSEIIQGKFHLEQNYPNPFNPTTKISYSIPYSNVMLNSVQHLNHSEIPKQFRDDNVNVALRVYDILGRKVATLVNKKQKPGNYEVDFDGSSLTSGIYLYQFEVGKYIETKKMVLIK